MSKFNLGALAFGALVLNVMSATAHAEHTRVTNPNAATVEVLGRGMLYTLCFDRVLNDDLAAGAGFGSTTLRNLDGSDPSLSTLLIPVYVNFYFMRQQGSLFASGGATVVSNPNDADGHKSTMSAIEFGSTPVLPTIGLGYENRSDPGFLFRVTAYGMVAKTFRPWVGLSLGYAF